MGYLIVPLNTGRLGAGAGENPRPGSKTVSAVPAIAFLITDGRCHFLFDTGMPGTSVARWHRPGSFQPPGAGILAQLRTRGLSPQDIQAVFLSHLHWDHCAYMNRFTGVPKLVQHTEAAFAQAPQPPYARSYRESAAILCDPHLETICGDLEICAELRLLRTPGHSPGHQSLVVHTKAGERILGGDAAWPDGQGGLGPPRKTIFREAARASYRRINGTHFRPLCSHDPCVLGRTVYGHP